jgi:hypothetical protein
VRFTKELKDRAAQNQREIMPPIDDGFLHRREGLIRIDVSSCHVRRLCGPRRSFRNPQGLARLIYDS